MPFSYIVAGVVMMWIFLWLVMIGVEVAGEWIEEKWNGDGIHKKNS